MSSQRSIPMEDRISALPDSILSHILSFLPTKLAVTTSILSKQWKLLWLSVLTLDFDDQSFKNFTTFRNFVYSVFFTLDFNLPIRSLHLKCGNASSDCDLRDVNQFVSAAVQRGIQNLNLCIYNMECHNRRKLDLSFLTCRTLVILKLKSLVIYDIPPMVDLPLLKTLQLDMILFLPKRNYFNMFFCGCPILEDLHINDIGLYGLDYDSEGNLSKLVTANISYIRPYFPFAWVRNAKFLRVVLRQTYVSQVPIFHDLLDMELIFDSKIWKGKWKWVIKLLQHSPKLQNLTIDEGSENVEVIGDEDWKDPETVPECLSSQLKTCLLRNYKGFMCELQFAEYIMHYSKLLCTMTVKSSCSVDENVKHQTLEKLSMCSRGSRTSKLLFD